MPPETQEQIEAKETDLKNLQQEIDALSEDVSNDKSNKRREELNAQKEALNKEISELTESLSTNGKYMAEIVRDTKMGQKMLTFKGWEDGTRLEKFSTNIDNVIRKFFISDLDFLGAKVLDSMSIGIQLVLMETLASSGEDGAEFFNLLGGVKTSITKRNGEIKKSGIAVSLSGLIGVLNRGGEFTNLLQKTENLTYFLSSKKTELKTAKFPEQLSDPIKFKTLLEGWEEVTPEELTKTKLEDVGITLSDTELPNWKTEDNKKSIKEMINEIDVPITKQLAEKIEESLTTTSKLLDNRNSLKSMSLDAVGMIDNLLEPLGSLWGIDLESLLASDNPLINLVLSLLGFHGGSRGLRREYNRENINKGVEISSERRKFIEDAFKEYSDGLGNGITTSTFDKISNLKSLKDSSKLKEAELATKAKIPEDYGLLKSSIGGSLTEYFKTDPNMLNLSVLKKYGLNSLAKIKTEKVVGEDGKKTKKERIVYAEIKDMDKFTDKYLQKAIPELVSKRGFLDTIQSSDSFAYALFGNLVLDKYFVEGVKLGIEGAPEREGVSDVGGADVNKEQGKQLTEIPTYTGGSPLILIDKVTDNKEQFQSKVIDISKNLGINPNELMAVMNAESGINHLAKNPKSDAIGLIQFMPETLKGWGYTTEQVANISNIQQLELVKKFYSPYKSKIFSLRDLYLATFFPVALDHKDDEKWIFQTNKKSAELIAGQNSIIDKDGDLQITMKDFNEYIEADVIPKALEA